MKEYSEKDKDVARSTRKDKRNFIEALAGEEAMRGDFNTVHKTTKVPCNKGQKQ